MDCYFFTDHSIYSEQDVAGQSTIVSLYMDFNRTIFHRELPAWSLWTLLMMMMMMMMMMMWISSRY